MAHLTPTSKTAILTVAGTKLTVKSKKIAQRNSLPRASMEKNQVMSLMKAGGMKKKKHLDVAQH